MPSEVSKRTSKIESYTRELLKVLLPEYEPIYNYRPDWLKNFTGYNLELDIYYPEIGVAVEVNGVQHILPYQKQKDAFKGKQCKENEVVLITIRNPYEILRIERLLSGCVPNYVKKDIPEKLRRKIKKYRPSKRAFFNREIRQQITKELKNYRKDKKLESIKRKKPKLYQKIMDNQAGQNSKGWTDEKAIDFLTSLSMKLHPEDYKI